MASVFFFCVLCLCVDDYACLWKGCEFLAMGSPRELEVHAHFHTYHSKLKFIGGQLLTTHPDLPNCKQDLHCNNLSSEGSAGLHCLWQHCDVCWRAVLKPRSDQGFATQLLVKNPRINVLDRSHRCFEQYAARTIITYFNT